MLKPSVFVQCFVLLAMLAAFSGCQSEGLSRAMEGDRNAFGKINRITVLCDEALWEGPVGDSIRFHYGGAYPLLPQPEPIFDLQHLTLEDLRKDPLRKELRTYLVVGNLGDESSETSSLIRQDIGGEKIRLLESENGYGNSVAKNKWARGQLVVYLYANSQEKLIENILNSYSAVAKRIRQADAVVINATTYFRGENVGLGSEIQTLMDVQLRVPEDFKAAIMDKDLVWLRRETTEASSNILIRKVPYTDQSQLSKEGLKALRNEIGRQYISTTLPDTYMRINDEDLPLLVERTQFNGDYALEARGIWDIVNDYMGGSFVSYLIYDPEKPDLLFIDAFLHAPGKEKRDMMQQLEYIVKTAQY